MNYEYLVCSRAFSKGFQVIKADGNNYLHLLGVHSKLSADVFFDKCIQGTLQEDDFDFIKGGQGEKEVKGSVRQKIQVLNRIFGMFECELLAEEKFCKNRIECAFATSDGIFTLGFAESGRPKSLMKSNELSSMAQSVDLIFSKPRNTTEKYSNLCFGSKNIIEDYEKQIRQLISASFFE